MRKLHAALLSAAFLLSTPAFAHDYKVGDIRIDHPWTRATPPGADVAGGYMVLANDGGQADRLVGGSSPAAERVEFHSTQIANDVMQMREAPDGVEIPAGGETAFEPGGYHLMLVGLTAPLVEGERVPVTLDFEKAGSVEVELAVDAMGSGGSQDHSGH